MIGIKKRKWTRKQEYQFFQSIHDLQRNGYSLYRSLDVVQAMYPKLGVDIQGVRKSLAEGHTLPDALEEFVQCRILDELSLVSLHGYQLELLNIIGQREQQQQFQRKRLITVLCYPMLLMTLLSIVGVYLSFFLMPQIGDSLCDRMSWWIIGMILFCLGYIPWYIKRLPLLHQLKLVQNMPIIGPIVVLSMQQGLCIQMGYLLMSGVNLHDVVTYCQKNQRYWLCQLIGPAVATAWENGETLESGLNHVQYLPLEAKKLFLHGNPTQQVGGDLIQLAKHLNARQEQRIQTGLSAIQPLFFILIGIMIVGLYMVLLLPMYDEMLTMGGME